jgi:hypothetical protein
MALQLAVQTGSVEGIDEIRSKSRRLGQPAAQRHADPARGRACRCRCRSAARSAWLTGRLARGIADDAIVFRIRGDVATARFGVQPVRDPGRGSPALSDLRARGHGALRAPAAASSPRGVRRHGLSRRRQALAGRFWAHRLGCEAWCGVSGHSLTCWRRSRKPAPTSNSHLDELVNRIVD